MKGCRSLHQNLFTEPPVPVLEPKPDRKGRCPVLKQQQVELIVCRYYFYIKLDRRLYEPTIEQLEKEIFLSKRTIIDILMKESAHLKMLAQANPDIKYFRNKYPFINWQYQSQS